MKLEHVLGTISLRSDIVIVPKGFELSPPQINANDIIEDTEEGIDDEEDDIKEDDRISKNISYEDDDDLDAWG